MCRRLTQLGMLVRDEAGRTCSAAPVLHQRVILFGVEGAGDVREKAKLPATIEWQ